jgi:hypothetical protein
LDARIIILLFKKVAVTKSEAVKTGSNLAETSKEGYGSKSAVLPTVMNINLTSVTRGCTLNTLPVYLKFKMQKYKKRSNACRVITIIMIHKK